MADIGSLIVKIGADASGLRTMGTLWPLMSATGGLSRGADSEDVGMRG
jgi:hypothetical protein